jgi:hypothetical protein
MRCRSGEARWRTTTGDGTIVHHDCREDEEANDRKKGSLPGDFHSHGVSSFFDTGIITWSRDIACDLRHSKFLADGLPSAPVA